VNLSYLKDGFALLFSGRISPRLWGAAIVASLLLGLLTFAEQATGWTALVATTIGIAAAIASLVVQWKITRALGDARTDQVGAVGAWMGWSVVSVLPALVILSFLIAYTMNDDINEIGSWWVFPIVFAGTMALIVPVSVHAAGRAIDDTGPSIRDCFDGCRSVYVTLAFGYFLAGLLPASLSELFLALDTTEVFGWKSALFEAASSISMTLSSLWTTAIAVLMWQKVQMREIVAG
jgi:hypothetical protein